MLTKHKKILFVLSSQGTYTSEDGQIKETGYFLPELTHAWDVLEKANYEIDFVSPKGGKAPVYGIDLEDPINKRFLENSTYKAKVENTFSPKQVTSKDYQAIYYVGGHGTMWDFPENIYLATLAAQIYENQGVIGGVCHGPAGLINIKLSNGEYLVKGKKINAFTNEEEQLVKMDKIVPFSLEDELINKGAIFEKSAPWEKHIASDQRVVTGQNPASAQGVGEEILHILQKLQ